MNGSSESAAATSLYDLFFELEENLCKRYPALTPFVVRREKFGEVVKLLNRINAHNRKETGAKNTDAVWKDSKGNTHIRRQAKNDNWY